MDIGQISCDPQAPPESNSLTKPHFCREPEESVEATFFSWAVGKGRGHFCVKSAHLFHFGGRRGGRGVVVCMWRAKVSPRERVGENFSSLFANSCHCLVVPGESSHDLVTFNLIQFVASRTSQRGRDSAATPDCKQPDQDLRHGH